MIQVFGSKVGQEELDEIKTSFDAQWLGIGKKVSTFEAEFAKRNKFKSLVMVDNCSNALYLAIKMLNVPEGSEIILPSFTFAACANAVLVNKCIPVFCDVDYNTMNCSINTIAPLVTAKTAAIMVVHYAGYPVNVPPILELGIPIIEDAAHAVDSHLNGVYCGSLGDIGCFSFDSMKNLSAGEGGAITAASPSLVERVRRLRYCGIAKSGLENSTLIDRWWEANILYPAIRHMPNDVTASIALAQLRKLDILQAVRKKIWHTYTNELQGEDWLELPLEAPEGSQHSYFTYAIKVKNSRYKDKSEHSRDKLAKYLLNNGIYTTLRYYPLHMTKIFKMGQPQVSLPVTEELNEITLSIPIHPNLKQSDVDYIIYKIKEFHK